MFMRVTVATLAFLRNWFYAFKKKRITYCAKNILVVGSPEKHIKVGMIYRIAGNAFNPLAFCLPIT